MKNNPSARLVSVATLLLGLSSCMLMPKKRMVDVEHPEMRTASGVAWREILVGSGDPVRTGDTIAIDYVCTLADGTRVDSSYDRGTPVEFRLGEAPLAGWNEGCTGMRKGGRRWLLVPADLAYGEAGVPGLVPPATPLEFEVELQRVGAPSSGAASGPAADEDNDEK